MRYRYYILFLAITMFGWNLFIINRDKAMFDHYDTMTPHEQYCSRVAPTSPDCVIE